MVSHARSARVMRQPSMRSTHALWPERSCANSGEATTMATQSASLPCRSANPVDSVGGTQDKVEERTGDGGLESQVEVVFAGIDNVVRVDDGANVAWPQSGDGVDQHLIEGRGDAEPGMTTQVRGACRG